MPLAWILFGWLVEKILLQFARFLRELKRLGLWDDFSSATLFSAALIAEMLDNFGTLFIRGNGRCWEIKSRTRETGQKASQSASSRPVASTKAFHQKLVANFSRRIVSHRVASCRVVHLFSIEYSLCVARAGNELRYSYSAGQNDSPHNIFIFYFWMYRVKFANTRA